MSQISLLDEFPNTILFGTDDDPRGGTDDDPRGGTDDDPRGGEGDGKKKKKGKKAAPKK
jgi:hypothetical protein